MSSPERGSKQWIDEQTQFVLLEAVHLIDAAIESALWGERGTGSVEFTIDTKYRQIDETQVVFDIVAYLSEVHSIPQDAYILTSWYGRDFDEARDVFKVGIVFADSPR